MRMWSKWQKRRKPLDRRRLVLVFARGGMLLRRKGQWQVYRSLDARRMCAGIVTDELAAELEAEAVVVRMDKPPLRLAGAPPEAD